MNALLAQGFQLRGSTFSRTLQEAGTSTCIPAGEAPFTKVAYVAIDLNGTSATNTTTFDLFSLATAFELAYDNQVNCNAVEGSRREVGRTNILIEAVGPDDVASELLRVELFCNSCGSGDEIELFRDTNTSQVSPIDDASNVECACEGPFVSSFLDLYNEIFAASITSNISIVDVNQLTILDCGDQNITTFNETSVCEGLDALAFQSDLEDGPSGGLPIDLDSDDDDATFPSATPSEFPSYFPSQYPSEFP